jgi:hypothetical protein
MVCFRRSITLLACSATFFAGHVFAYPTNDNLVLLSSIGHNANEKAATLQESVYSEFNSTIEHRGLAQCFASLCCFGQADEPDEPTEMAYVCPVIFPSLGDLQEKVLQYGAVPTQVSFFYTVS